MSCFAVIVVRPSRLQHGRRDACTTNEDAIAGRISWTINGKMATMTNSEASMRCRIHRGCHEIGGNCIEIESQGKRIVLDIGLPLKDESNATLPDISGLTSPDDSLLGIFISHPHPDHYGLLEQITEPVPVFMGEAARKIIEVIAFFTPLPALGQTQPGTYSDAKAIQTGPFAVTPLAIDHSAHDSYCLLVEAEGKRLLYSGDLRAHGRKADLFHRLVSNPPPNIDVLICEGTQIGRVPDFAYPDEHSVAARMTEIFKAAKGMCLVWCSGQNTDRIATVFEAAMESGRQLILDLYTAEIMRATGDPTLPKPGRDGVAVYLPLSQKSLIMREKAYNISNRYYPHRIYPENLAEAASTSVMIFRPSMLRELQGAQCLSGAILVSSVWSGYVHRSHPELDQMEQAGIKRFHVHTSGHATVEELQQFVAAFPNSRVVPIHLEDREAFGRLFSNVEPRNDHEWWEVSSMADERAGFYFDGQNRVPCIIIRTGPQRTRIKLENGSKPLVPSECVKATNEATQSAHSERLIPTIPLETFYRPLRKLTGTKDAKYHALYALLNDRYGPKGAEFLSELFRRSVRHAESYGNIEEAFYPNRTVRSFTESQFAKHLVEKMSHCKPIDIRGQTLTFVDYEIFPFRTTLSCGENGKAASRMGSGGMDLLLASLRDGVVLPAIGEIKACTEAVGPTFALVQSLMYAAQMATRNQFLRINKHYPEDFGAINADDPRVDVIILLEADQKPLNSEDLQYALTLADDVGKCLSKHLRHIMFLWCSIVGDAINCEVVPNPMRIDPPRP